MKLEKIKAKLKELKNEEENVSNDIFWKDFDKYKNSLELGFLSVPDWSYHKRFAKDGLSKSKQKSLFDKILMESYVEHLVIKKIDEPKIVMKDMILETNDVYPNLEDFKNSTKEERILIWLESIWENSPNICPSLDEQKKWIDKNPSNSWRNANLIFTIIYGSKRRLSNFNASNFPEHGKFLDNIKERKEDFYKQNIKGVSINYLYEQCIMIFYDNVMKEMEKKTKLGIKTLNQFKFWVPIKTRPLRTCELKDFPLPDLTEAKKEFKKRMNNR